MIIRDTPAQCGVNEHVKRGLVLAEATHMTWAQATAFRKFTGLKYDGQLYRIGDRIFDVGIAHLAKCVYNHSRQF